MATFLRMSVSQRDHPGINVAVLRIDLRGRKSDAGLTRSMLNSGKVVSLNQGDKSRR